MSNNDVRSKYEQITSELHGNKRKFAEFLTFSGRFYKLPSAQAIEKISDSPDNTNGAELTEYAAALCREINGGE